MAKMFCLKSSNIQPKKEIRKKAKKFIFITAMQRQILLDAFQAYTFMQLYEERNIDEFEDNWHQKFPLEEFERLSEVIENLTLVKKVLVVKVC